MIYFSRMPGHSRGRAFLNGCLALFFAVFCMNAPSVRAADIYHDLAAFVTGTGPNMTAGFDDVDVGSTSPYTTEGVLISPMPLGPEAEEGLGQEVLDELVGLDQPSFFNNGGSPPNFILVNAPGFMITFPDDVLAAGLEYVAFAGDTEPGDSSFQWALYSDSGEIIDQGLEPAEGFAAPLESNNFFGVVSPSPFRSITLHRVETDGSMAFGNWLADEIRYANAATPQNPAADAGDDQIVIDEVALDGDGSLDHDGAIVSFHWDLQHRENPGYNRFASGETPVVSSLEPGFYDVTLTVYDDDGLTGMDEMTLAVAGGETTIPPETEELDLNHLVIIRENYFGNSFIEFSGRFNMEGVELPEGAYEARVAIQIAGVLDNNADLVISKDITLEAYEQFFWTFLFWDGENQHVNKYKLPW